MTDNELIAWLKENSSGIYRPAYAAAERIEELLEDVERNQKTIDSLERDIHEVIGILDQP